MTRIMMPLLAQEGSQAAAQVIERSLNLSRNVAGNWDRSWEMLTDNSDLSLWSAIVNFSLIVAVLSLIYYAISQANNVLNTVSFSKVVEMFITPIVVVFLLGGNGYFLAQVILILRGVGRSLIFDVLRLQLGGISLQSAINQVNSNMFATQRIRQVFQECASLTGEPLTQCLESKQAEAQAIIDAMGQDAPAQAAQSLLDTVGDALRADAGQAIQGIFTQVIQSTAIPIIQTCLLALQWAYVNISEAALLLTALFAPIAVALMLFPVAGSMLSIWFTGFMAILAIQLGYVLLVGLAAAVLVMTDAQNQTAISAAGDYGFLVFISIFAPTLATAIGRGGGASVYQGIAQKAAQMAQATVQVVASGIKLAAGAF